MFQCFYPKEYLNSVYEIDFFKLYQEGYRGVLFDIDNTLVPHGAPADKKTIEFFQNLRKIGMKTCLISNNQIERVKGFADSVESSFIENAHKPAVKNYYHAMKLLNTNNSNTIFVGDQVFTDIYGANRAHIRTILVKPIHPKEEIQIVLKRYLEKIVLYSYQKNIKNTREQKEEKKDERY